MPAMVVESVGVGAGTLDRPGLPNVLRAFVGETVEPSEIVETEHAVVECNVDDLDPRVLPVVIEVDWRGPEGPAHVEFKTVLSRY